MPRIGFGPFELDTDSLELRRDGRAVLVRPQPCRVLSLLINQAGTLVSREQLRRAIWPAGVYVRFDAGLHACLKHIRRALGESATAPRYIETLPGRGYRFVGTVRVVAAQGRVSRMAVLPFMASGRRSRGVAHELRGELTARLLDVAPAGSLIDPDLMRPARAGGLGWLRDVSVHLAIQGEIATAARRADVRLRVVRVTDLALLQAQRLSLPLPSSPAALAAAAAALADGLAAVWRDEVTSAEMWAHLAQPIDDHVNGGEGARFLERHEAHHVGAARRDEHKGRVLSH